MLQKLKMLGKPHWRHRKVFSQANFRKTLKVSHFCLGFFPNENNNEIKHSQQFY